MSDKRILLLSQVFPPQAGGSGRWFWEIYRRFSADRTAFLVGEESRQAQFDAAHQLALTRLRWGFDDWGFFSLRGAGNYLRLARRVLRLVKHRNVNEIHCGRNLPEGWIGWLLYRWRKTPYVCYVHGEELNLARDSRQLAWMTRQVYRQAKLVVANSENTAALLRGHWNVSADRLRIMYPGVDASFFVPDDSRAERRERLGWAGRTVLLTVGRLQVRKGQDRLIEALPGIRQTIPDVLYVIIGDGKERDRLVRLVAELGLEKHVQFRGEAGDREMLDCYQECDLFVLPNRDIDGDFEGFGIVLLEAQACGKPVIAGASGGTRETMELGVTGRLVDCTTPGPLAEAIVELLADSERRRRMGAAARKWAAERFDWNALARQAAELFDVDLAESSSGAVNREQPPGVLASPASANR